MDVKRNSSLDIIVYHFSKICTKCKNQTALHSHCTQRLARNVKMYQISDAEKAFLECSTGSDLQRNKDEMIIVAQYLRNMMSANSSVLMGIPDIIHQDLYSEKDNIQQGFRLLTEIARVFLDDPDISLNRLVRSLVDAAILRDSCIADSESNVKISLFYFIGWMCLLYKPDGPVRAAQFRIDPQGARCFSKQSASFNLTQRPFDELLRSFGHLLPTGQSLLPRPEERYDSVNPKLYISNLNICTMKKLAGIEIVWVDTLAAHLDFDPTIPSLKLFRCPSFCEVHASESSVIAR
jgi:hypothetical protein